MKRISTLIAMFLMAAVLTLPWMSQASAQSVGTFLSSLMPCPVGPRKPVQSAAERREGKRRRRARGNWRDMGGSEVGKKIGEATE